MACTKFRATLHAMLHRLEKTYTDDFSRSIHTNFRYLNTPEKNARLSELQGSLKQSQKQVRRLKSRLEERIKERSTEVDSALHQDLLAIMKENETQVLGAHEPGQCSIALCMHVHVYTHVHLFHTLPSESFPSTFWKQQKQAATKKNLRGMRWDPLMVRWCLYLRHLSSGAYELLRSSGVLSLPSQRTLRDYTYYTTAKPGFSGKLTAQYQVVLSICLYTT